jgi:hypothetical protein
MCDVQVCYCLVQGLSLGSSAPPNLPV